MIAKHQAPEGPAQVNGTPLRRGIRIVQDLIDILVRLGKFIDQGWPWIEIKTMIKWNFDKRYQMAIERVQWW